jgi:hypothetical protein
MPEGPILIGEVSRMPTVARRQGQISEMPGWVGVASPDMLDRRNAASMTDLRHMRTGSGRLGDAPLPCLGDTTLPRLGDACNHKLS